MYHDVQLPLVGQQHNITVISVPDSQTANKEMVLDGRLCQILKAKRQVTTGIKLRKTLTTRLPFERVSVAEFHHVHGEEMFSESVPTWGADVPG